MLREYADITSRLGPPLWWDGQGTPRYAPFAPDLCGVYDEVVALVEVACQSCGARFRVACEFDMLLRVTRKLEPPPAADRTAVGEYVEYGDPPTHDGCAAGPTMNSVPVAVLEFWRREGVDWTRAPEYEGPVRCAWMEADRG